MPKPAEREPRGTDPDVIRAKLGLPATPKPKTPEEILVHLQGEKPEAPVDPDELGMVREVGGLLKSLFGDKP